MKWLFFVISLKTDDILPQIVRIRPTCTGHMLLVKTSWKKIILPSNVTLANQILNLRSSRTLPAIKIGA